VLNRYRPYFIWAVLILGAYMAIVFSVGKYYLDDNARVLNGYYDWQNNGRPLASAIVYLVNFGNRLTDISPLAQMLSIFLCAAFCAIISSDVIRKSALISVVASSFLFTSPLFIQNLSFRFDAITMCFSIFILIVPFIKEIRISPLRFYIASFLCVHASLLTYQASIPVYYACLCIVQVTDQRMSFRACVISLASASASLLAYVAITSKIFIKSVYAENVGGVISLSDPSLYEKLYRTWRIATYPFTVSFDYFFIAAFIPVIAFAASVILYKIVRNKTLDSVSIALPIVAFVCSFLMFYILENPNINPRMMVWASAILVIAFSISAIYMPRIAFFLVVSIPLAYVFSFANDYLISQSRQFSFEKQIINEVAIDAKLNGVNGDIYISGRAPLHKQTGDIIRKRPLISDLMRQDIGTWSTAMFATLEYPMKRWFIADENMTSRRCNDVIVPWNGVYTISKTDSNAVVSFKPCD